MTPQLYEFEEAPGLHDLYRSQEVGGQCISTGLARGHMSQRQYPVRFLLRKTASSSSELVWLLECRGRIEDIIRTSFDRDRGYEKVLFAARIEEFARLRTGEDRGEPILPVPGKHYILFGTLNPRNRGGVAVLLGETEYKEQILTLALGLFMRTDPQKQIAMWIREEIQSS